MESISDLEEESRIQLDTSLAGYLIESLLLSVEQSNTKDLGGN